MRINDVANMYAQSVYADYMRYAINNRNEQVMNSINLLPQQIFTPQFNPQQYLQKLSDFQNESKNTYGNIKNIMDRNSFESRSVLNNDSENISVKADNNSKIGSYEINVSQIAQNQINQSSFFNPNSLNNATSQNSFQISYGDNTYNFNVNIQQNDTNYDILNKVKNSINDRNIGVTANIQENDKGVSLLIQSDQTGVNQSFSISDINGSLVNDYKLNNTTQNSQDLKYKYNNQEFTQNTNSINLENGIEVNVSNTGTFSFDITYNKDQIKNDINDFIGELNSYLDYVSNNSENLSDAALSRVDRIKNFSSSLEKYGISYNNTENKIQIDNKVIDNLNNNDLYAMQNAMNMVGDYAINRIEENANSSLYQLDNNSYQGISNAFSYGPGSVNDTLMGAYMQQNLIGNLLNSSFNGYA